ncbi:MAG: hypothetical protein AB1921_17510 [Thermodesulfobacteriota bacterium]
MITIELTGSPVEGEPGPNLYWMGSPPDYLKLILDLHLLGRENGREVLLHGFDYVSLSHCDSVTLRSRAGANDVRGINGRQVRIELDKSLWQKVLHAFFGISFYPSHDYVDWEGTGPKEDANFIISSEHGLKPFSNSV